MIEIHRHTFYWKVYMLLYAYPASSCARNPDVFISHRDIGTKQNTSFLILDAYVAAWPD